MKKLNEQHSNMMMVGVVALVAIIALVLNTTGSLEGASTHEVKVDTDGANCFESDPDQDYYVKGSTLFGNVKKTDYCLNDGKTLVQYHCTTSKTARPTTAYECPKGCFDGACIA